MPYNGYGTPRGLPCSHGSVLGRTGSRPNAKAWFDRQMRGLENFDVTLTFCFTPEHRGTWAHYTAPPQYPEEFAEFCATMLRNYA